MDYVNNPVWDPLVEDGLQIVQVFTTDAQFQPADLDFCADYTEAHGIDFAFVKASEGETLRDPQFDHNWAAAKAAGLTRGAYHFYRADGDLSHAVRDVKPPDASEASEGVCDHSRNLTCPVCGG